MTAAAASVTVPLSLAFSALGVGLGTIAALMALAFERGASTLGQGSPCKDTYGGSFLRTSNWEANFGGGNTSAKLLQRDPLSQQDVEVLWVKGSGGDLGTLTADGLA